MIPLLTASVVAMTVILERSFWRRLRVRRGSRAFWRWSPKVICPRPCKWPARPDIQSHVCWAPIAAKHLSPSSAMQAAAQAEVSQARRYLPILDTVITLAPLLGLLGTITGMISAFGIVSGSWTGTAPCHHWRHRGSTYCHRHRSADRHYDPDSLQLLSV